MIEVVNAWGCETVTMGELMNEAWAEQGPFVYSSVPVVLLRATDWQRIEALLRDVVTVAAERGWDVLRDRAADIIGEDKPCG